MIGEELLQERRRCWVENTFVKEGDLIVPHHREPIGRLFGTNTYEDPSRVGEHLKSLSPHLPGMNRTHTEARDTRSCRRLASRFFYVGRWPWEKTLVRRRGRQYAWWSTGRAASPPC